MAIDKTDPIIFDQGYTVDENSDVLITLDASISQSTVEEIGRLNDRIARLESQIATQQANILDYEADKAGYQQQIDDATSDGVITNSEARLITRMERSIARMDDRIAKAEASIADDEAEIATLQQTVDYLESEGALSYAIVGGDPGGLFQIDANGNITTSDGSQFDYESGQSYTLVVEVTETDLDGTVTSTSATVTIDVGDLNEAPTGIGLTSAAVAENDAGAVIGDLSVSDPDIGDSHTLTVSDSRFEIVGGQLKLVDGVSLDHEAGSTITVSVTATDAGGNSLTTDFAIAVGDLNEAPTAISLSSTSVDENSDGAVVCDVMVTDPDNAAEPFGSHSYTVSDARFEIVNGQLKLKSGVSLDFEAEPSVTVDLTAIDGAGASTSQSFVITVNDRPEGVTMSVDDDLVTENVLGDVVGTISLNGGATPLAGYSFSVDDPRFEVDGTGQLKLVAGTSLDFETEPTVDVTVTVTDDSTLLETTQTFTVNVVDLVETPTTITSGTSVVSGGSVVSSAGDVNDDGFDDILVAHPDLGTVTVIFGSAAGLPASFSTSSVDGSNGFAITGATIGAYFGEYVNDAGDVNGDGIDDIIVGAGGDDAAYVIFGDGGAWSSSIDVSALDGSNGFAITGAAGTLGYAADGAGDVNGDGYDDMIVTVTGGDGTAAYVVYGDGGAWSSSIDVSTLDGSNGFTLVGDASYFGDPSFSYSVSSAGDVNGDGVDDLLVGTWEADAGGGIVNVGQTHVVFGDASGSTASVDLAMLDGSNGFTIQGIDNDGKTGHSVSSAGDVNGDGIADMIIGSNNGDGAAYVVFGQEGGFASSIDVSALDGTNGFMLTGVLGDNTGVSVGSAGDLNGDGYDDLVVGANFSLEGGGTLPLAGATYVVFGAEGGWGATVSLADLSSDIGFELSGSAFYDMMGWTVDGAGDIDGDGFDDLIAGALAVISPADYATVVYGDDFTNSVTFQGTSGADTLLGSTAAERFVGDLGDDLMVGGGGADVLYGGAGNDTMSVADTGFQRIDGGSGFDTLALDGSGMSLDLTAMGDLTIEGVEAINLSGSGANSLTLEVTDMLAISDESNDLFVTGDADDAVTMVGGWSSTGTATVDGVSYETFSVTGVSGTLYVEADVTAVTVAV